MSQITKDTVATIEFKLSSKGEVLDSSEQHGPFQYLHGTGSLIPGLEPALEGAAVGQIVNVSLAPEQAFGAHKENLLIPVPRKDFGQVPNLAVGMRFQVDTSGGPRIVRVAEIHDESVIIDANHPWAGLTVDVEAKVVDVRPAKPEEMAHGHVCYGDHSCHQRKHAMEDESKPRHAAHEDHPPCGADD